MEDKQKTQSLRILKKCFCFFFVFLADVRQASVLLSLADDDLMTLKVHKYMYLKTNHNRGQILVHSILYMERIQQLALLFSHSANILH